ncbi:MAG: glycosyltransferase family 4 protein [Parvibaculum sp.]|nr:glycosyltransferase family 4 protein [Parvibaculum sp.]
MLKIAHIITRFINGGADENTLETCNYQAAAGHQVTLIYGDEFTDRMLNRLDKRVSALRVPHLVRPVAPVKDIIALARISRHLAKLKPDIVHTHTSKAGFIGRLATLATPQSIIVHGVHILPFTSENKAKFLTYLALEKIVTPFTDHFIDVSDGMRDLCLNHRLGAPDQHNVIASGMDIDQFRSASPAEDLQLAKHNNEGKPVLTIGYIAVLEKRKRHRELIEAIAPLLARHSMVRLVFAGDGPEKESLQSLINNLGLAGRINLLGFRDDPEAVIAACDICVFFSEREGLPRSVVQYAIGARPIVAMNLPGLERIVRHDENGYIANSSAEFSDFLETLITNPDLRSAMAKASGDMNLSAWSAREMAHQIEQVYHKLLSSPSAMAPKNQTM